ncbi:antibiotic biosynthesis monooxygenase family protein [Streptomyces nanshensis]|uniref:Antibiotic biosynthesis monooxygenase n=1 Tax=Streptomyces nanshensis TaxID=518642 RepID=A0A1E7LBW3_9ACTN|nr:antibiotic biosynthesis monooxygenase family protein [Streptomyces nanshensis]OEV13697.1 antibiotic biosynthesis monooxygenase [Streptomyces nanshensis]
MANAQGTFRILLRMNIKQGVEREFEETWAKVGEVITRQPANLGQWLSKSAEEPGVYYIVSDWVDEPSFREFERSAEHVEHRTKLHPFRDGGTMVTMHTVLRMVGAGEGAVR